MCTPYILRQGAQYVRTQFLKLERMFPNVIEGSEFGNLISNGMIHLILIQILRKWTCANTG